MAGHHGNWFRARSGPFIGQAFYMSKKQQALYQQVRGIPAQKLRASIEASLQPGSMAMSGVKASQPPKGVAQKAPQTPPAAPGATGAAQPVQTPGIAPTRYTSSVSKPQVVVNGEARDVIAADGDLVVVKDSGLRGVEYRMVHVGTGVQVGTTARSEAESTKMLQQADPNLKTNRHLAQQQALDKDGRATKTIRAPLPNPGDTRGMATTDDILTALGDGNKRAILALANQHGDDFGTWSTRGTFSQKGQSRGDVFLAMIQQAYGFDALPQKVSKEELAAQYQAGEVEYMTYRNSGSTQYTRETIDGNFFGADNQGRAFGAGLYACIAGKNGAFYDKYVARDYVTSWGKKGHDGGLMSGIRKGAKLLDAQLAYINADVWRTNEQHRLDARTDLSDNDRRLHQILIDASYDIGYFAAMTGYDGIRAQYSGFQGAIMVNRSAMVVRDTPVDFTDPNDWEL